MTDLTELSVPIVEIDGRPATAGQLLHPALSGYGHFTAMQVRDRRVRAMDLHLSRLDAASRELWDTGLDGGLVRAHIRHALGDGIRDASVRVHVFRPGGPGDDLSLMVSVRGPAAPPGGPQRLRSVAYQRPVAHLKSLGGFAQGYYRDRVAAEGFDEALLVAPDGTIAEGAITNIGFVAGGTVVWPDAPALAGISMGVLQRQLTLHGVPWVHRPVRMADVESGAYEGAFVSNSHGVAAVGAIDSHRLPVDAGLLGTLARLFDDAPWDPV
jgi:branched-subunit amino acid aminotransferase/4-amino-4-deoxychorismate lyase